MSIITNKVGGLGGGSYQTLKHFTPLDSILEMIHIQYHCSNQYVLAVLYSSLFLFSFGKIIINSNNRKHLVKFPMYQALF